MKVNIKLDDDEREARITGIAVMPNEHVVACDYSNHTIKLLDNSWTLTDSLPVETYEPRHEKTNVLVFDLVRHKPGCTATKDV